MYLTGRTTRESVSEYGRPETIEETAERVEQEGGVGSALAAYWQGSLTWWAFAPDRPLPDHLVDRLSTFLGMFPTARAALAPDLSRP